MGGNKSLSMSNIWNPLTMSKQMSLGLCKKLLSSYYSFTNHIYFYVYLWIWFNIKLSCLRWCAVEYNQATNQPSIPDVDKRYAMNIYRYLPTPPLGQDITQGQFLSRV